MKNPIFVTRPTCVVRGGSWGFDAPNLRVSDRDYIAPSSRGTYLGFRIVRTKAES